MGEEEIQSKDLSVIFIIILAILGRMVLQGFPSIEPIIPFAIYAGLVYGFQTGLMIAFASYLLSNYFMYFYLDQWGFLQAAAGGIATLTLLQKKWHKPNQLVNLIWLTGIGTIMYEFVMNLFGSMYSSQNLIFYFISSLEFSFTHIISNLIIAAVIGSFLLNRK